MTRIQGMESDIFFAEASGGSDLMLRQGTTEARFERSTKQLRFLEYRCKGATWLIIARGVRLSTEGGKGRETGDWRLEKRKASNVMLQK